MGAGQEDVLIQEILWQRHWGVRSVWDSARVERQGEVKVCLTAVTWKVKNDTSVVKDESHCRLFFPF